jgi:hypothetical protein
VQDGPSKASLRRRRQAEKRCAEKASSASSSAGPATATSNSISEPASDPESYNDDSDDEEEKLLTAKLAGIKLAKLAKKKQKEGENAGALDEEAEIDTLNQFGCVRVEINAKSNSASLAGATASSLAVETSVEVRNTGGRKLGKGKGTAAATGGKGKGAEEADALNQSGCVSADSGRHATSRRRSRWWP